MGWFSQGMDEEFVIRTANVRRYREDPDTLDEVLARQHARDLGSTRGLRESQQDGRSGGVLDRLGRTAAAVGLGLLLAHFWTGHRGD
jgi:hypothetical protein